MVNADSGLNSVLTKYVIVVVACLYFAFADFAATSSTLHETLIIGTLHTTHCLPLLLLSLLLFLFYILFIKFLLSPVHIFFSIPVLLYLMC